jgi:hypothetical protein
VTLTCVFGASDYSIRIQNAEYAVVEEVRWTRRWASWSGDAALQELLTSIAEHTHDPAKKAFVANFLLTLRPLAEWSQREFDVLTQTCGYVISLARMGRELGKLNGGATR